MTRGASSLIPQSDLSPYMDSTNLLEAKATRIYPFSAEQVFNAWLDPKAVGSWMFGPAIREEEVVSIDIDPRVGGAFSFLVNRGNRIIDHVGTYQKIEKPYHLEFDWGVKGMSDSSRVKVTIAPYEQGCKLELVHYLQPAWAEYLQRSIDGWSQMLDVLERSMHSPLLPHGASRAFKGNNRKGAQ